MTRLDKRTHQNIYDKAELFLETHNVGLLNKDKVARHIFLCKKTPPVIPIAFQIIGHTNNVSIKQGIIVEYPHWNIDDSLHAIVLKQVQSMTTVRKMTTTEIGILTSSAYQV